MKRPCETCFYMAIASDGISTPYCAHPDRKQIGLRAEREKGACGPDGVHHENRYNGPRAVSPRGRIDHD